jgi:hypothetical protein
VLAIAPAILATGLAGAAQRSGVRAKRPNAETLARMIETAPPAVRTRAFQRAFGNLGLNRDRTTLRASRYQSFRDGFRGTRELISGSMEDGFGKLLPIEDTVLDFEVMRRYQATMPTAPKQLLDGVAASGRHTITSNISEQPQIFIDEKASGAGKPVLDMQAMVNKNALAVQAVLDAGVNVVKIGSKGLSLYEMFQFYRGVRGALPEAARTAKRQRLQELSGIGLIDVSRVDDVAFVHDGREVGLDEAIDLARQGKSVSVAKAKTSRVLTDVDALAQQAMTAPDGTAEGLRAQINAATKAEAFEKARRELLLAKLAGLRIFLIDTQLKDKGFNRFHDMFTQEQLVALADQAHELGIDIWAAGSLDENTYGDVVKAGWNLACFGGAARDASGLRPTDGNAQIDPERVKRIRQARIEAEQSDEAQLADWKMFLLERYHQARSPETKARFWTEYQLTKNHRSNP